MLPFDLSQYSVTARDDLCMELYRMTERRLALDRTKSDAVHDSSTNPKGGVADDQS